MTTTLTTRAGPPPPRHPATHPWAAAAGLWATEVNLLQGAADHPVFATVDQIGVHLACWWNHRCPTCGGTQPAAGIPWTVPPQDMGGITWGWRHTCGGRWAPETVVYRWDWLEQAIDVGHAPSATATRVQAELTTWLLTKRPGLIPGADEIGEVRNVKG